MILRITQLFKHPHFNLLIFIACIFCVSANSQTVDEYFEKGMEYYNEQDYDAAIRHFSLTISHKAGHSEAYFYRGESKFFLADYRGAAEDFTSCIQYDPDNSYAYLARGDCKYFTDHYEGAIRDFTKALKLNPGDGKTYAFRADAKYYLDDYTGAISDYSDALSYDYKEPEVYHMRGNAYFLLEKYRKAENDLSKAIRLDKKEPRYYLKRALIRQTQGKIEDACIDAQKAEILGSEAAQLMIDTICRDSELIINKDMTFCDILNIVNAACSDNFESIKARRQIDVFSMTFTTSVFFIEAIESYILDIVVTNVYVATFSEFDKLSEENEKEYTNLVDKVKGCLLENDWIIEEVGDSDFNLKSTEFTSKDPESACKTSVLIYKLVDDQLELQINVEN